jgi:hypothetical protein
MLFETASSSSTSDAIPDSTGLKQNSQEDVVCCGSRCSTRWNVLVCEERPAPCLPMESVTKTVGSKRVRMADTVTQHDCGEQVGFVQSESSWLSKAECRQSFVDAKREVQKVQQTRPEYLQEFSQTFLACSNPKASLQELLTKDKTIQRLLHRTRPCDEIRGLEYRAIINKGAFSQYRRLHVQTVVQVQHNCAQRSEGEKSDLLRSVSMKTSRPLRKLARLLGRMDEIRLHETLKKELAFKKELALKTGLAARSA